jgi:hypothetical protein
MAFFPENTDGILSSIPNIFATTNPLEGVLTPEQNKALRNKSITQGLLGTALTYLAQPKTENYGSAVPYLAKAYIGGMGSSQDVYNQAIQGLKSQAEMTKVKREQQAIEDLLKVPEVANNPALKGLIQAGQLSQVADYLYPKTTDQYNVFSMANYNNKPFNQLTPTEKQNVIKLVEESKKNSAMQLNLGSPVAGVDPTTGQPVFFQASRTGGKPEIVPGIVPKSGEAQTKQIGGIDSLNSAIQSYKDKLKTWSPTDAADPNKRAQMKTVYNNMMLQAKEAYGLGVLNGPDYTILTDTIADPTTAKGVAYGAFGALEGQADTLSELMQRTKESLQGGKGIKPKENAPPGNQPKVIKFNSKGERVN